MGFKLNYRLNAPLAGVSNTGKNTLALPYFRQTGQNNALDLVLDIGSGTVAAVNSVAKFNEINDTFTVYTARMGAPAPFALAAGEGYFVNMASNVNYIVVGSHDPSLAISLDGPTPGVSNTGKNFLAPPYNITATNAHQLVLDIGGGVNTPILSVSKFVQANDTFLVYTDRMGAIAPFPLAPGEAYFVNMASSVPYTPSHY
jgi:hypothetical protein